MPTVRFKKQFLHVEAADGANLRDVASENGVEVYQYLSRVFNCHGHGFCGTCLVRVEGEVAPRTRREDSKLRGMGLKEPDLRLACQCRVVGDVTVTTAPRAVQGWMEHADYAHMKVV
ncbi:MAG: (2Fe-2S)-binding protein [Planctomycetes bacterium]|nr:(2Fe-2S)-binding protein [Planctomycetota bacterium]